MQDRVPGNKLFLSRAVVQLQVIDVVCVASWLIPFRLHRIEQRVFFNGQCIEGESRNRNAYWTCVNVSSMSIEWFFKFGFVMPGSTNSWEHVIEAATPGAMLSAEELSGNVTFETSFCDDKLVLCKNLVRIFYV